MRVLAPGRVEGWRGSPQKEEPGKKKASIIMDHVEREILFKEGKMQFALKGREFGHIFSDGDPVFICSEISNLAAFLIMIGNAYGLSVVFSEDMGMT